MRRKQRASSSLVKRGSVDRARVRACAHWPSSSGQKATYTWSGGGGDRHAQVSVGHTLGLSRQNSACEEAGHDTRAASSMRVYGTGPTRGLGAFQSRVNLVMVRVTLWWSRVTRVRIGKRVSVRVHTHWGFRSKETTPT